jgi:hypothetical protein
MRELVVHREREREREKVREREGRKKAERELVVHYRQATIKNNGSVMCVF